MRRQLSYPDDHVVCQSCDWHGPVSELHANACPECDKYSIDWREDDDDKGPVCTKTAFELLTDPIGKVEH